MLAALSFPDANSKSRRPPLERDSANDSRNNVVQSFQSASLQRPQLGVEQARMYPGKIGRTSPPSKNEVRGKLAQALTVAAPTAKHVAREIEASPDTAEGWRAGTNIPSGYNLILLARQFPEVRAVVLQFIQMEADLDPEAMRLRVEIEQFLARRG